MYTQADLGMLQEMQPDDADADADASPSPCPRVRLAEVHVERSGNDRARNILILEVELVI